MGSEIREKTFVVFKDLEGLLTIQIKNLRGLKKTPKVFKICGLQRPRRFNFYYKVENKKTFLLSHKKSPPYAVAYGAGPLTPL